MAMLNFDMDLQKQDNFSKAFTARKGDAGEQFSVTLFDNQVPYVPASGDVVSLRVVTPSGKFASVTGTMSDNKATFTLNGQITSEAGYYQRAYVAVSNGTKLRTTQDLIFFSLGNSDINNGQADYYVGELDKLLQQLNEEFDEWLAEREQDYSDLLARIVALTNRMTGLEQDVQALEQRIDEQTEIFNNADVYNKAEIEDKIEPFALRTDIDMKADKTFVTAQLAQTTSEVELSKKVNNDLMKQLAQSVNQNNKDIVFLRSSLDSWVYSEGIEIVGDKLTIVDDSHTNTHANVALFKGVPNARSIEIELGGGATARARIAFGKDENNFFYGAIHSTLPQMDFYRVENGSNVTSSVLNAPLKNTYQLAIGDRLRTTIHNQNIQIFINDVLHGTLVITDDLKYLVEGNMMAGVGFRDAAGQRYEINRVSISPKRRYKYIHFSIDDVISVFEDISTNGDSYSSIFENDTLNWLKNMHDRFGIVVSLFLFYQNENNTWNLSQMPNKYRSEFRKNSNWLKLGFHGLDVNAIYDGSEYTPEQALEHYNDMISQIKRFAHPLNIDSVPRTAFFTGDIDTVRGWKKAPNGVQGFLTSDDDRTNMMYLDKITRETLKYCDDFYDADEDLYFVKTDLRLEHHTDPISELESKFDDYSLNGQHEILEVFTHEGPISGTTNKVKAEAVFEWGLDSGYVFDFPMNNIMKS